MALTLIDAPYSIVLSDAGQVASYQAQYPTGVRQSPADSAIQFSAPISAGSGTQPDPPRIDVYGQGNGILTTSADSATWAANFTITGQQNLVALTGEPGGTITWVGFFVLEAPVVAGATPASLQTRRWCCGFEIPEGGDNSSGGAATSGTRFSRDASRTSDGKGFAYRALTFGEKYTETTNNAPASSWERFYIRPRTYPVGGSDDFWSVAGSSGGGAAVIAIMTVAGAISFYNLGNQAYPGTLLGTTAPIPLNTWARIDILLQFATATTPTTGSLYAYVNGALSVQASGLNGTVGGAGGLSTTQTHTSSSIGKYQNAASNNSEIDFDDWINSTYPTLFTGVDWLNGSHVQLMVPTGLGAAHANWAGNYRILEGNPVAGQFGTDYLASTTSGAIIDVTTEYTNAQLGYASFVVSLYASQSDGVAAQLGYKLTTSGVVQSAVTSAVSPAAGSWISIVYTGGTALPLSQDAVNLYFVKAANANSQRIQGLQMAMEFIGVWGTEDEPNVAYAPKAGIHNAPYWQSYWSHSWVPPAAPVAIHAGTYTGNGTGQDIATVVPLNWWWCYPTTGDTGGSHWWSSMLAGHGPSNQLPTVNRFIRAYQDLATQAYYMQVSGDDAECNANGVTYQWVGVSDPGMRYMLNGAFSHLAGLATATNALKDTGFTPLAAFLYKEALTSVATGHYYKGPGHTTNRASPLNLTDAASIMTFAAGQINTLTAVHAATPQTAYSAWRITDGTTTGPFAITSYTGDNTNPRNIALALGGKSPLFVLVVPHDGVSYFRTPSHTSSNSSALTGAVVTTGITAGTANQITVNSTLNANLVVYDVFAIAGADTSGWGTNPAADAPIYGVATVSAPSTSTWVPDDTRGWWWSTIKFTGASNLATEPQNPKHPRGWDKIAAFATAGAGALGGSPGAGVTFNNHLIYAGDDYTLGVTNPTIRIFDGLSDRLMATIPSTSAAAVPIAIMSMIIVGGTIYLSTLDSGTSSANWAGRVFTFDPESGNLTPLSTNFSSGEVPYALTWHMGRLWVGTNNGIGSVGKVYYIRPGIDTAWTTDYALTTDTAGAVDSMLTFQGSLYVGSDNVAGTFAKVLKRTSLGVWSVSLTATGGTARVNNGYLSLSVFESNLYAGYYNPDTTAIAKVEKFDGTNWSTAYTPTGVNIRPFIGQIVTDDYLLVIGGGKNLSAALLGTIDGTTWDILTPYLTGPTTETALPIHGTVGT
jgi:hypothetical protein